MEASLIWEEPRVMRTNQQREVDGSKCLPVKALLTTKTKTNKSQATCLQHPNQSHPTTVCFWEAVTALLLVPDQKRLKSSQSTETQQIQMKPKILTLPATGLIQTEQFSWGVITKVTAVCQCQSHHSKKQRATFSKTNQSTSQQNAAKRSTNSKLSWSKRSRNCAKSKRTSRSS